MEANVFLSPTVEFRNSYGTDSFLISYQLQLLHVLQLVLSICYAFILMKMEILKHNFGKAIVDWYVGLPEIMLNYLIALSSWFLAVLEDFSSVFYDKQ